MVLGKQARIAEAVRRECRGQRPSLERLALGGLCVAALSAGSVQHARAQDGDSLEQITVTGSRLRRDGMSTPTPVTAVEREEMRAMAPTLLMDAIQQLPQFRDNDTSQTGSIFSTGGSNSVNLRGVGSNRTLTLLNGRRMVSGQQTGTIDIAMVPTTLLERVEVVTGGASAAYGSDAISGVTNFILDTDFEGFRGNVQMGQTARNDHASEQLEVAVGSRIGENGHLVASFDFYEVDGVYGYADREWAQEGWALVNAPGRTPQRFYAPNVNSASVTRGGLIPLGPLAGTRFVDGAPVALNYGERFGSVMIGGTADNVDYANDWGSITPNDERSSVFAHYMHDLGDDRQFFVQALKGYHNVLSNPSPTPFVPAWSTQIFVDNPYLPESVRDRMIDLGLESVPFNRVYEDFATQRQVEDDTTSITLGFEGEIGNDLFLTAYYQWGENVEIADYNPNYRLPRTDRFYRALDSAVNPATGNIECRANIPAFGGLTPEEEAQISKTNVQAGITVHADPLSNSECVPFDPFATRLPDEVVDYIAGSGNYHRLRLRQDVVEVTLQTDLAEARGSGPISLGGGFSYRNEWMYQDAFGTERDPRDLPSFGVFSSFVDPADQIPIRGMPSFVRDRALFWTGNPNSQGPIRGEFDVWEVFAESIIPIFGGDAGTGVDVHLAARYADYAGSGGVWASKAGLDWQATDTVRLRGTWSRDTRAGTLSERFDSQTGGTGIGTGDDPLLPNAQPYVAELTTGGNPEIRPELSDTTTIGVVWQPSWAENLSMSIDFYDISIEDAIDQLGTSQILDRCYIQGAQDICALITRVDGDPPVIRNIRNVFVNVSEAVTRGADIEVSYARPINIVGGNDESVRFRLFANYLEEVSFAFAGVEALNEAGSLDYPEWLATGSFTYNRGPFGMTWQTRYRDATVRNPLWVEGVDIEDNTVSSRTYTNLNLSYDFEWGDTTAQAYFYVGNLFDKEPPLVAGGVSGFSGSSSYTNQIFDELGRTYTVGIQIGL